MGKLLELMGWGDAATERLSVRMPARVKDQLIALKVNTGSKNMTELLRRAFSLMEWAWEMTRDGGKIVYVSPTGEQTTMVMPWERPTD